MNIRLIGFLVAASFARPQNSVQAPRPEFEVASVRKYDGAERGMRMRTDPGGLLNAEHVPASVLIREAYGVRDFQIVGGPAWIRSERYDITARATVDAGTEELRQMIQSLLADRFKLAIHREVRNLPVYELVAARGGLKLASAKDGNCITPGPLSPLPPAQKDAPPARLCGGVRMRGGVLDASETTVQELGAALSDILERPVIDRTGFTKRFDAHLEYAPPGRNSDQDPIRPSVFTVLQEELGLRLEAARDPVDVFVIDHAERPGEN